MVPGNLNVEPQIKIMFMQQTVTLIYSNMYFLVDIVSNFYRHKNCKFNSPKSKYFMLLAAVKSQNSNFTAINSVNLVNICEKSVKSAKVNKSCTNGKSE
jgi:hypothetical protein